jgi:hypothetical protein
VEIDIDSFEVQRILDLLNKADIKTGYALWSQISNNQAHVLAFVWAPTARRDMPALRDQKTSDGFPDVQLTLQDLGQLGDALTSAKADAPPEAVTTLAQLKEWIRTYSDAVRRHSMCVEPMTELAINMVSAAAAGLTKPPWLDSEDHGWIRFEMHDRPR